MRSPSWTTGDRVGPIGDASLNALNAKFMPTMVTSSTTAIQKAKMNSALMLTSRFSQPARGSTGTSCFSPCLVAMRMLQHTFKTRIVQRQQRHFLQLGHVRADPDAADADESANIDRGNVRAGALVRESRHDQPENVDERDKKHPEREDRETLEAALDAALQQDEERHEKMQDQQGCGDISPRCEGANFVPGNFLLQVAGPDD